METITKNWTINKDNPADTGYSELPVETLAITVSFNDQKDDDEGYDAQIVSVKTESGRELWNQTDYRANIANIAAYANSVSDGWYVGEEPILPTGRWFINEALDEYFGAED